MALRPQPSLRPILCGAGASLGALAATGLNQPALLAARVTCRLHALRQLLHEGPHTLPALLRRKLLANPLQGIVGAAHGPVQRSCVSSHRPVCSQVPHGRRIS